MNESNAITTRPAAKMPVGQKPSALKLMASRLSVEEDKIMATLKGTVFKNASNEEMLALVVVANEYDLNPFLKEIYAFPAKGGGIVPIVSVDGWNKMLIRQPDFDGIEFDMVDKDDGTPHCCTATVYVKGRSRPVKITEYFDECYRKTEPWENMPRRMLRNRTLCQASRVAFGFAGVQTEDEAASIIDISTEPAPKVVRLVADKGEAASAAPKEASKNPCDELGDVVTSAGYSFEDFQKWGVESGNIPEAADLTGYSDVKQDVAKRALRNRAGLLTQLENIKAGGDK